MLQREGFGFPSLWEVGSVNFTILLFWFSDCFRHCQYEMMTFGTISEKKKQTTVVSLSFEVEVDGCSPCVLPGQFGLWHQFWPTVHPRLS